MKLCSRRVAVIAGVIGLGVATGAAVVTASAQASPPLYPGKPFPTTTLLVEPVHVPSSAAPGTLVRIVLAARHLDTREPLYIVAANCSGTISGRAVPRVVATAHERVTCSLAVPPTARGALHVAIRVYSQGWIAERQFRVRIRGLSGAVAVR